MLSRSQELHQCLILTQTGRTRLLPPVTEDEPRPKPQLELHKVQRTNLEFSQARSSVLTSPLLDTLQNFDGLSSCRGHGSAWEADFYSCERATRIFLQLQGWSI